ncbi:ALP1-like protein isoform X1 [Tanacetum coccineum]|uniref:ALP1-like protein isoform X1 n=1 Tax=Tanacetum coccineum TaxID=301880 RepID=A0ABQ4XMH2_9ASTR
MRFMGWGAHTRYYCFIDNSLVVRRDYVDDLAPVVPYVVNGVQYRNGYYLADGIYPEWASFVKSFTVATDPKHTYFKQRQESARKDVERAFGVLQGRWGLIQTGPCPTRSHCKSSVDSIDVKTQRRKAKELRDKDTHISLQQNLMNHIWREVEEASEKD